MSKLELARIDAIPDGGAIAATVDHEGETLDLVLVRSGEAVKAYHNVCPHAGRRLDYAPGQFLVRNGVMICAAHGASFDCATGRCLAGPGGGGLSEVAVDVVDGTVCLHMVR